MLGGYVAGLVAAGAAARVTLKRPVAAGRELWVDGTDVTCDDEVVATVATWDPADLAVPPVVTPDEMTGPAAFGPGPHPVPGCYVCGPRRGRVPARPPGPGGPATGRGPLATLG